MTIGAAGAVTEFFAVALSSSSKVALLEAEAGEMSYAVPRT
jgi:hypothetical protein